MAWSAPPSLAPMPWTLPAAASRSSADRRAPELCLALLQLEHGEGCPHLALLPVRPPPRPAPARRRGRDIGADDAAELASYLPCNNVDLISCNSTAAGSTVSI
jgi:hypothetical protein